MSAENVRQEEILLPDAETTESVSSLLRNLQPGEKINIQEWMVIFPGGYAYTLQEVQAVCLHDESLLKELVERGIDVSGLDDSENLSGAALEAHQAQPEYLKKITEMHAAFQQHVAQILSGITDPAIQEMLTAHGENASITLASILGSFSRAVIGSIEKSDSKTARVTFENRTAILHAGNDGIDCTDLLAHEARGNLINPLLAQAMAEHAVRMLQENGQSIMHGVHVIRIDKTGCMLSIEDENTD